MRTVAVPENFPLTAERCEAILERLSGLRIAVLGDFHLDVYWHADMRRAKLSRETPHFARPVVSERYDPGVGGVITANLYSLGVGAVYAVGACGDDWRGEVLRARLSEQGTLLDCFLVVSGRITPTYIKPIIHGYESMQEDPRLDFQDPNDLPEDQEVRMLSRLDSLLGQLNGLCVIDQIEDPTGGIVTARVRRYLASLGERLPRFPVLADSRSRIHLFRSVIIKVNRMEAARALGCGEARSKEELLDQGARLFERTGRPVFVSAGSDGMGCVGDRERYFVPAVPVEGPIDPVGAGDSASAALVGALASGASLGEAAAFANLTASVTVTKIGRTGVATPQEMLDRFL